MTGAMPQLPQAALDMVAKLSPAARAGMPAHLRALVDPAPGRSAGIAQQGLGPTSPQVAPAWVVTGQDGGGPPGRAIPGHPVTISAVLSDGTPFSAEVPAAVYVMGGHRVRDQLAAAAAHVADIGRMSSVSPPVAGPAGPGG